MKQLAIKLNLFDRYNLLNGTYTTRKKLTSSAASPSWRGGNGYLEANFTPFSV